MVPSPPSASETMNANLDHALSAVVSGNREIAPAAPSAATRRVGDSRALVSSSVSIAAPRIATFCSLRTKSSLDICYIGSPHWVSSIALLLTAQQ